MIDLSWKRCEMDFEGEVSLTKQAFADECDINFIMSRWETTGQVDHVSTASGVYGDFENVEDYQTSLNILENARKSFDELPSRIRTRFQNDPYELISFVNDENNRDEAIQLGLISPVSTTVVE